MVGDRTKWNAKYRDCPADRSPVAPEWLRRHLSLLPVGTSIDLATGLGSVPIVLAQRGWRAMGVDVSDEGLRHAAKFAAQLDVHVDWLATDLTEFPLPVFRFDLITVFYYLDRDYFRNQIIPALRPGGMLVVETFTVDQILVSDRHTRNPAHMLQSGELLDLFYPLAVRAYREVRLPDRAVASLVAQKRQN